MDSQTRNELINFFNCIVYDLTNERMSPEELELTGQVYMYAKFNKHHKTVDEIEEDDFKKYLFTGWYIYTQTQLNQMSSKSTPPSSPSSNTTVSSAENPDASPITEDGLPNTVGIS